ncbi:MAG: phosphodiester glycosidase family protein [Acidimicrobiales bacterium]
MVHAVLAPGVHHYSISQLEPANDLNIAVVEGAAVELKAVSATTAGTTEPRTVSDLCRRWACLVAVNGDMFLPNQGPLGAVMSNGQVVVPMPASPVPAHWQLSAGQNGRMSVDLAPPPGTAQSTGASYPLVLGGQVQRIAEQTPFTLGRHPRTIIGWNAAGRTIIVTVDGRSARSRGMSLAEGAALMVALGATEAVNLDGGGSTTFVVNGQVANRPSEGRERRVANAWVVVAKSPSVEVSVAGDREFVAANADDRAVVAASSGAVDLRPVPLLEDVATLPDALWAGVAMVLVAGVLCGHGVRWRTRWSRRVRPVPVPIGEL